MSVVPGVELLADLVAWWRRADGSESGWWLAPARVYRYIRDPARAFHRYDSEQDVRELMDYAEKRPPALGVRGERP